MSCEGSGYVMSETQWLAVRLGLCSQRSDTQIDLSCASTDVPARLRLLSPNAFAFMAAPRTYNEAESQCVTMGGHLVSIPDASTDALVSSVRGCAFDIAVRVVLLPWDGALLASSLGGSGLRLAASAAGRTRLPPRQPTKQRNGTHTQNSSSLLIHTVCGGLLTQFLGYNARRNGFLVPLKVHGFLILPAKQPLAPFPLPARRPPADHTPDSPPRAYIQLTCSNANTVGAKDKTLFLAADLV